MSEENDNSKKISFWIKLISGIIGLFVLVGGVVFSVDSRYATAESVKMTASSILQTIQQDRKNADIRFYQQLLEQSHEKETEIIQGLQVKPNDHVLRNRLNLEKQKQQIYQQKLDKLLSE